MNSSIAKKLHQLSVFTGKDYKQLKKSYKPYYGSRQEIDKQIAEETLARIKPIKY